MKRALFLVIVALLALPLTVSAQEATAVADGAPTLESVTADPGSYYGMEVTFEGVVVELVNIRSFVLGEGAAIDDDQVLVLNNSGQEFNIGLTRDARVRVTGTIYPAFDQGGWDQLSQEFSAGGTGMAGTTDTTGAMTATEEAAMGDMGMEATDEAMAQPTPVPAGNNMGGTTGMGGVTLADYPLVVLQDRFPSYTLLVINSVDNISFVEDTGEAAQ